MRYSSPIQSHELTVRSVGPSVLATNGSAPLVGRSPPSPTNALLPLRVPTPTAAQTHRHLTPQAGGSLTPVKPLQTTGATSGVGRQSLGTLSSASLSPARAVSGTATPTPGMAALGSTPTAPSTTRGLGVAVLPPADHFSPKKASVVGLASGGYTSGGCTPVSPVGDGPARAPSPGYTPPATAANVAFGGFPAPTMQVLETKFREIVQMHLQAYVQDLFVSVETSLEKHLSALSGRIEQVEEHWTRSLAAGLATERQERERALSGLGQEADSLPSPPVTPNHVAQSTPTQPLDVVCDKVTAVAVRADTLEASMSEMRTDLRTVQEFGYGLQQDLRQLSQVEQRLEQRVAGFSHEVVTSQAAQASQHVIDVRGEVSILRGELRDLRLLYGELQERASPPRETSCNVAATAVQETVDRLSATVPALEQQIEEVSLRVARKIDELRLPLQSELQEACAANRSILLEEVAVNARQTSVEFEAKIQNLRTELRSETRAPASESTAAASIGKQEVQRNEHLLRVALVQQAVSSSRNEVDTTILKKLQERPTSVPSEGTLSVPLDGMFGNDRNKRPSTRVNRRQSRSVPLRPVDKDVVQRRVELVRCALRGDADLSKLQPKDGPKSGK